MLLWVFIITVVWFFFWFFPWQVNLHGSVWLRLGIALGIFMVPGMSLYGLLAGENPRWVNHITFGFVISHLLLAFMGTLGRITHLSFELVANLMMGLGIALLLLYLPPKLSQGFSIRFNWTKLKSLASFWTLGLVSVLVILIVLQREFSDDDLSYLAFLTNTQYSSHLGFNDIFFGLAQPVTSRFWLMSAPFAQAFLADRGDIPGILILGGYYEPFLVIIAMLCWYELARALRLSHRAASASVTLQVVCLILLSDYLHPGAPFFHQLSVDKATATFIFVPVFIQSEIGLLRELTRKNIALFLLSGLSLTFMHPIALAYAVFIGSMLIILNTPRDNFRFRLIPMLVLVAALLPQIILRFIDTGVEKNVPYGLDVILNQNGIENMITLLGNTQFYGFNLQSLGMAFPYGSYFPFLESFLKWAWLVVPIGATIFAIRKLKQSELARYIFSAFLLCALVGFPFTGWIVGYFLSAWALERALWLFPFGLSAVFLLMSFQDGTKAGKRVGAWMGKRPEVPHVLITVFTSVVLLLYMREQGLPDFPRFETKIRRYVDIANVGHYLDRQIKEQSFVMGSEALNDLLPGVSFKARVVTFRTSDYFNMSPFPIAEIEQRIADRQTILSATASPDVKLGLLRKYDVGFVVLTRADRDLFADLVATYPSQVRMEKVNRFFVLEVKDE